VAGAARRGGRESLIVALRAGGFAAILVVGTSGHLFERPAR